ncbi:hypothetical protein Aglo03_41520 [Actinokineospora globicatena]|uniref:Uncharacterized protein n=1 Tax=Actinokineospora globicatena TaxID=103729 RepID=A0A9W6VBN4_9PSEU|nr:hypothetical protein Aglo03_41520 [Actinokineospora globicatena]
MVRPGTGVARGLAVWGLGGLTLGEARGSRGVRLGELAARGVRGAGPQGAETRRSRGWES